MSAEKLRRVAALMREDHGPTHPRHLMWHLLANWMESEGDWWAGGERMNMRPLLVADEYLATREQP